MNRIHETNYSPLNTVEIATSHLLHSHEFMGENHRSNEIRTWIVIILCASSMVIEIVCGIFFKSLALIADGLHMSTHVAAFFISATAYSYAREHRNDNRFVFGTGKVGELAAYTSAILLIIVAIYILYEGMSRMIYPEELNFLEALYVSFVGLTVNIASGLVLTIKWKTVDGETDDGVTFGHSHGHNHFHGHDEENNEYNLQNEVDSETFPITTLDGTIILSIFEENCEPAFRIEFEDWSPVNPKPSASSISITIYRSNGSMQKFQMESKVTYYESIQTIPEPHEFRAVVGFVRPSSNVYHDYSVEFEEHGHDDHHDDEVSHPSGHDHGRGHQHDAVHDGHEHDHHQARMYEMTNIIDHNHNHTRGNEEERQPFSLNRDLDHIHDNVHGHDHRSIDTVTHGHEHHRNNSHKSNHHDHSHEHDPSERSVDLVEVGIESQQSRQSVTVDNWQLGDYFGSGTKKENFQQDNNFRAAVLHVVLDAAVSILVIIAISIAGTVPGCNFLDPLVAMIGSLVILSWAYQLIKDTSINLLDMNPNKKICDDLRATIESDGTKIVDLHIWRLGPGHLGAILSVVPKKNFIAPSYYRRRLKKFKAISHATIEVLEKL